MTASAALQPPSAHYQELAAQAALFERLGNWGQAGVLYQEMYSQALGNGDVEEAANALVGRGWTVAPKGQFHEAREVAYECIHLAERNGLARMSTRATSLLGSIHFLQSDYTAAADFYTRARDMARALSDDLLVGSATQNLGIIANIQGDFREARALYLESIASTIRTQSEEGPMRTYLNLGKVCVCLQDWLEAEVYFERGIEIADLLGDLPIRARLYANLAIPLVHSGEFPRAATALSAAARLATRIPDSDTLSHVARLRGMIGRLRGDLATAHECLAESLRLAVGPGSELARAEALEETGRLYQAEGLLKEARTALEKARSCFLALGAQHDLGRVEALLSQCRLASTLSQIAGVSQ